MKDYRCPYCGQEAFSFPFKLGVTTRWNRSPRCRFCKQVSFRRFIVGGRLSYYVILGLSALLSMSGVWASINLDFKLGTLLFPIAFIAFYLLYNYYFCYFDRADKDGANERLYLQLKEEKNSWPNIRKGEIYVIGPLTPYPVDSAHERSVTAMLENKAKDQLQFRILSTPPAKHAELKGEVAIFCDDTEYAAIVVMPTNDLTAQED